MDRVYVSVCVCLLFGFVESLVSSFLCKVQHINLRGGMEDTLNIYVVTLVNEYMKSGTETVQF